VCGISGEVRLDGRRPDVGVVDRMAETMCDRGPDGAGSYMQGRAALGHRRLKIVDLTEHAAQPMVDSALGLAISFNGMIYNYPQLRAELESLGHSFFSTGDTEVVLKGYREWGDSVVEHLIGMFAFALVERDTGRVMLARDRLGIKPLYLAETPGRLRFASTLPALLAGGDIDTTLDPVALHHYLTWHSVVPAPRTILAGVRKMPPATVRVIEPDGTDRERVYWDPPFTRDPGKADWSARDWEDAIEASLRTAVDRRMIADVPVGVLLSGGLDSSLIVGLLAEAGQRGLATFSIGFESVNDVEGDEFRYSDVVAEHFGTAHHQLRIGTEKMLPALETAIRAMAEPMVSHDAVAFHLLSQEVAKHRKVVQSGQGADEVFGGYHWYPPMLEVGDGGAGPTSDAALESYIEAFFDRPHSEMAQVLAPQWALDSDASRDFVREHFARPGAETPADAAFRLDTQIMLVDDPVKRVDNMTMGFGLEARVPFLDHELVELAGQCPPELKLAQGGKGVLKEVGRRVIPAEVIDRPKGYFPVPALTHLAGPYLDRVREALLAPAAKERGLFREDYVDGLLADPNRELTRLRGNKLWQLGLLELWLQSHGI
jgi:asparagine synthase (glutamine-hydrolysing)